MKQYVLIGVGIFALALAGKHFLLSPASVPDAEPAATLLPLQEPCNLHQAPCVARDAAGHFLRFSIIPDTIPLMQDLTVSVETAGFNGIQSARLTVEGVNMFMGYQYADLRPVDAATALSGKLVLPVCSMETMQWNASLLLTLQNGARYQADFPFSTSR